MNTWRYIEENGVSAGYGLATDEFLMSYYSLKEPALEPTLRLYTYQSHCALVGRFQNIEAELDLETCSAQGIQFGRRPTGGGAIIMGEGQLGVCLTASSLFEQRELKPGDIYRVFSEPIILALEKMGIQAHFSGKNDLEVGGKKIAGLGVYYDSKGALLFHTSLLVDLDIPLMLRVLRIPAQKLSDKVKIRSVQQRITTISRELGRPVTLDEVRRKVGECFQEVFQATFDKRPITAIEQSEIQKLIEDKYNHEDWIFQRTPLEDMTGMSLVKTPAGLLRVYLSLNGDTIKSVLITGDFFDHQAAMNKVEAALKWCPLDKGRLESAIHAALDQNSVVLPCSVDDIVKVVWRAGQRAKAENGHTYAGSCYYPDQRPIPTSNDRITAQPLSRPGI